MRRKLITLYCLLFTQLLVACMPDDTPPSTDSQQTAFFVYRFELPAFVGFSEDFQITKEIPFSYPVDCGLYNTFPAPIGQTLAVELSCPNGQSVLFMDAETGIITLPFIKTDSHFLAWTSDGKAAYLKVDSLGSPQIVRAHTKGTKNILPISEFAYDLAAKPDSNDFTFTTSRGLGYGSELYFAEYDGQTTQLLYADQYSYISFASFSPDGKQIAFIKIPDTQTPFTVGELWVMDSDGSNARKVADADAGHGYAANWSPDGKHIAFVVRENPQDEKANQSSDALISNIYVVDMENGKLNQVTHFENAQAETPSWSPDGNTLAFNVVVNGRISVSIADAKSGEIKPLETESTCCPAWMRK